VKDPPTFYTATGLRGVVIPYGCVDTLSAVISRYDVQWVLLDEDHPRGLSELYLNPDSVPWLRESARFMDYDGETVYLLEVVERVSDHETPSD
jgi:hypothetical protein